MRIDVPNARLAASLAGDGPPLILLHAGVADRRVWNEVTPGLAEDGWKVIAPDRRGFGETSVSAPGEFSHVDDLLAVMDALSLDAAVLVGNSQGGRVAIDTALTHPDRVRALVLIAPAITGRRYEGLEMSEAELALEQAMGTAEESGDLAEVNRLEAHYWLDGPAQLEGRVSGAARELFLDMNRIALQAGDVGTARWADASWDRLGELDVPVLVVGGRLDEMPEAIEQIAPQIGGATTVWLDGSAHLPMLDDPAGFLAAVRPFLVTLR